MIQQNIARILDRIEEACRKTGRDPGEIVLVAVTKFADTAAVKAVLDAGVTHVGENKVQEARRKFPAIEAANTTVVRHMIGHLQSNKVKQALHVFDCIQSVDSLKLAEAIEAHAARLGKEIDILIQVNTAGEVQKFGADPTEVFDLIDKIAGFRHVRVKGLMTIAPMTDNEEAVRSCFRDLRRLRDEARQKYAGSRIEMTYLSMGMTDDFEIAVEEGADMVRIGRAIFQEP